MTLSPVFRSERAVRLLEQHGIWERFGPALALQMEGVQRIHETFATLIDARFRLTPDEWAEARDGSEAGELAFLQDYFFLTLFLAVFESLGVAPERLPFYADLNFCIMGTITAADNLFDDQAKSLLPLRPAAGARYASILQLMSFERLLRDAGDRAAAAGRIPAGAIAAIQRGLLDQMATIGLLEGSEEGGVDEIPTPEEMIEHVHRVRGGLLFGLAFVAPRVLESGDLLARIERAAPAIAQLGTAFQIVDDLTDFEFDLTRRTHNLLVSRVHHHGSVAERAKLAEFWHPADSGQRRAESGLVEGPFAGSARAVLDIARAEARQSLATLAELGFWFPVDLADEVVHAIVGLDGMARMESLAGNGRP